MQLLGDEKVIPEQHMCSSVHGHSYPFFSQVLMITYSCASKQIIHANKGWNICPCHGCKSSSSHACTVTRSRNAGKPMHELDKMPSPCSQPLLLAHTFEMGASSSNSPQAWTCRCAEWHEGSLTYA
eukprot:1143221-Pelagomonas_calceolata.AAC.2